MKVKEIVFTDNDCYPTFIMEDGTKRIPKTDWFPVSFNGKPTYYKFFKTAWFSELAIKEIDDLRSKFISEPKEPKPSWWKKLF